MDQHLGMSCKCNTGRQGYSGFAIDARLSRAAISFSAVRLIGDVPASHRFAVARSTPRMRASSVVVRPAPSRQARSSAGDIHLIYGADCATSRRRSYAKAAWRHAKTAVDFWRVLHHIRRIPSRPVAGEVEGVGPMQLTVNVIAKSVYGRATFYPAGRIAGLLAQLAGTKTLTEEALVIAKRMGMDIVIDGDASMRAMLGERLGLLAA